MVKSLLFSGPSESSASEEEGEEASVHFEYLPCVPPMVVIRDGEEKRKKDRI